MLGGAKSPISGQGRGSKLEAQRADGGGSYGSRGGAASPLPISYGSLRERCNSPSGVRGKEPWPLKGRGVTQPSGPPVTFLGQAPSPLI